MKTAVPAFVVVLVLAVTGVTIPSARQQAPPPADEWRTVEGSWIASGQRRTLPTDAGRTAATSYLSGAVVLTAAAGTSRGFQGEVITFDDGAGVSVGRAVWTDERGDRIFSRLDGDAMRAARRIVGTVTGGTGRYSGIEGEYAFEWQYVVQGEDGAIQGHTVGLKGRFHTKGDAR
jgi:hypothetical protein